MTFKNIFPILLLATSMLFTGCSNDAPVSAEASSQQPSPAAPPAAAPSPTTTSPADTSSASTTSPGEATSSEATVSSNGPLPKPTVQPGEQPLDMTGNAAPKRPSNNEVRSTARPSDKVVKHDSPFKANTTAAVKKQNPAGKPTGFIGRENIGFYSEPSATSKKISTLKVYESVIILETKMTDEAGKSYDMPQWYKVQLTNKQVGWVVGSSLTLN